MQLLLTSIDYSNISLLHQCYNILLWEYLTIPANAESVMQYRILGTLKIPET